MSANPQALGAALYTLGQGISGASDAYFGGQIKAAQIAQADTLKAMQIKAAEDQRAAAAKETAQYHADTLKQRGDEFNQTMAEKKTAEADTNAYRQQDLGLRATQIGNEASHQQATLAQGAASLAERTRHDKADEANSAAKTPVSHSQLPVLKTQIDESDKTISALQKQMTAVGSYSDSYKGLQSKMEAEQAKRQALLDQLNNLGTSAGGVAPPTNPQAASPAPAKPSAPAPAKPAAPTGRPTKSVTVNGTSMQAMQAPDGNWYVQQDGKYYKVSE